MLLPNPRAFRIATRLPSRFQPLSENRVAKLWEELSLSCPCSKSIFSLALRFFSQGRRTKTDAMLAQVMPQGSDDGSRVRASYWIETAFPLGTSRRNYGRRAIDRNILPRSGRNRELRRMSCREVEHIRELESVSRPSFPAPGLPKGAAPLSIGARKFTLSWPLSNMGPSLQSAGHRGG